ncbi:MAG TPA: hypothetical protein VGO47_02600, partial [Chlamydiales bacterium]|nr:hypothetical protein [Chlamydiales bacterium]
GTVDKIPKRDLIEEKNAHRAKLHDEKTAERFSLIEPKSNPRGNFYTLGNGPDESRTAKSDWVESEQQSVKPLFGRRAVLVVNEFVFGHKKARKSSEKNVDEKRGFGKGNPDYVTHAEKNRQCV